MIEYKKDVLGDEARKMSDSENSWSLKDTVTELRE